MNGRHERPLTSGTFAGGARRHLGGADAAVRRTPAQPVPGAVWAAAPDGYDIAGAGPCSSASSP